jgi:protein O-GlcNAc transferase
MHPPPTTTPTIRAILEQARTHHIAGQLADAARLYRQVLRTDAREPDANHNLGLIAASEGQYDAALAMFQKALSVYPMHPQFLASLAGTLLTMGRNRDARDALQRGFQRGVRNAALEALFQQAQALPDPNRLSAHAEAALLQLFKLGLHDALQQEVRRLLVQFPENGFLWKTLGASLHIDGKDGPEALAALRKAAELLPEHADAQNNLAVALGRRGDFAGAAHYSRRALQAAPQFIEALRNLAGALHAMGDPAAALEYCNKMIALRPDANARINLAMCLRDLGRPQKALEQLDIAAHEGCDSAELHCNVGIVLQIRGRIDEAIAAYHRALERDGRNVLAWNNLGNILHEQNRTEEAAVHFRRALEANPGYADAHNNLGVALRELGRRDEAAASFERALACRERYVEAHSNLGNLLHEMGRFDAALTHCRQAVAIDPQLAEAHSNLGHVLHAVRRYEEALASFRRTLELKPNLAEAHSNLGALYRDIGRLDLSVQSYRAALQNRAGYLEAHSGLLFSCNYLADESGPALLAHARRYGAAAANRARPYTSWPNTPDPARRLRIGFVSSDLYRHPVGYFLENTIAALHDGYNSGLELHAYAGNPKRDDLSGRLKRHFDTWHDTFGLPDEKLAHRIREDRIDILLDLSGHTTGTRLSMFAWKPSPVQASWLGYFATTGLAAMDYVVADPWTLPSGEEAHFSETVWRLPETRLSFSAPEEDVAPGPLPALANGYVTFGCCNNLSKLGDAVIALWARILHAVPGSRLLLKSPQFSETARQNDMLRRFAAHGIAGERLILEGPSERADYLRTHRKIDIALDPFPYTGGTTTAEALWMGVPVLTLAGERFVARQGVGLLTHAGLADWIAEDADGYAARALAFAADLPALACLRAGLREQLLASTLCDAPRFASHFEAMLRAIWRNWCEPLPQS